MQKLNTINQFLTQFAKGKITYNNLWDNIYNTLNDTWDQYDNYDPVRERTEARRTQTRKRFPTCTT